MSYKIEQINNLEQDGEFFTTFLLTDSDGIMPDIRVEKLFKVTDDLETIIERQKKIDSMVYEIDYLNNI